MKELDYQKTVNRVGITTIIANIVLALGKIIAGFIASSSSLVSDGVHSSSDVVSTVIVMIGAKISQKESDEDHPFGHERLESIASIILSMILIATALMIGYDGIINIIKYAKGERETYNFTLTLVALGFAVLSIIVKAWMYFYTLKAAKRISSSSLKADAFHHLTDSLSSIGSTLGIIGLLIGGDLVILDPIASIIIALFIVKVGIDIAKEAIDQVVDKSAPSEFENSLREIISEKKNILSLDSLKTRQFGNKYYVEIEIAVDDKLTVKEGHDIALDLHDDIESRYNNIKHCMIHVNPYEKER